METKFNFNSQICTTREQSESLLALGLKKETADMFYAAIHIGPEIVGYQVSPTYNEYNFEIFPDDIPAWSLHRLIEMMPFNVLIEGGFDNCFTLIKNYPKGYSVEYDGYSYYYKENIYDTIIEGIEHLIKEGHFNKEYLV